MTVIVVPSFETSVGAFSIVGVSSVALDARTSVAGVSVAGATVSVAGCAGVTVSVAGATVSVVGCVADTSSA